MGFAGAGWSEEHDVAGLVEEPGGGQVRDHVAAQRWLMVEVELLDALTGREPGVPDPHVGTGGIAGRHFPVEHGCEVFLVGPAVGTGLVGQPAGVVPDPGRFQRGRQVRDVLDRIGGHDATPSMVTPNAVS